MKWIKVSITTTEEARDVISDILITCGSKGVEMHDPQEFLSQIEMNKGIDFADDSLIEQFGKDVIVIGYFNDQVNQEELLHIIKEKISVASGYLDTGNVSIEVGNIDDVDWENEWKAHYKPFYITDNILIKPTWENADVSKDDIVIELDPGMAFGTGIHETTKMCSKYLARLLKKGDKVLDIGCGTGILSIISAKLGADSITALDIDVTAVKVAEANAIQNKVNNKINTYKSELKEITPEKYDIIVANIIADIIIDISELVRDYLKQDGILITSGIIKDRKDDVLNHYRTLGYSVSEIDDLGEWVAICFNA